MRDGTRALTGPWTCNEPSLPGAMRVSADEELHRAKAQGRDRIVADE
jgi:PleD family two-component response regulator